MLYCANMDKNIVLYLPLKWKRHKNKLERQGLEEGEGLGAQAGRIGVEQGLCDGPCWCSTHVPWPHPSLGFHVLWFLFCGTCTSLWGLPSGCWGCLDISGREEELPCKVITPEVSLANAMPAGEGVRSSYAGSVWICSSESFTALLGFFLHSLTSFLWENTYKKSRAHTYSPQGPFLGNLIQDICQSAVCFGCILVWYLE